MQIFALRESLGLVMCMLSWGRGIVKMNEWKIECVNSSRGSEIIRGRRVKRNRIRACLSLCNLPCPI